MRPAISEPIVDDTFDIAMYQANCAAAICGNEMSMQIANSETSMTPWKNGSIQNVA